MPVDYEPPAKRTTAVSLTCDGIPHVLDVGGWSPPREALTHSHIYLNVDSYTLKDPAKPGRLRIFMRRGAWKGQPIDDTFFYDLWLARPGYGLLDSRSFFEWADPGRALSWRYQVNGASEVVLSTRFTKYAQVW